MINRSYVEMQLVRLIKPNKSWADYKEIADALLVIKRHADSMEKEQQYFDCAQDSSLTVEGER